MTAVYTEHIGIKVSKEQRKILERYAEQESVNVSTVIRWFIEGKILSLTKPKK